MENAEVALILTGTLPEITGNFDACKAFYETELLRYASVVDPQRLPAAKADLAKLRGEIKRLDRIRIDEATRLKAPITAMESKVKELTGLIQNTADKIESQVKACEEKTLASCRALMLIMLAGEYERLEVRAEFQTGAPLLEPMVKVSGLTGSGHLTKSSSESVQGLAQQARGIQDRTDGRLARLEADCWAAGLTVPLQREHIERFLQDTDEVYSSQLVKLIKIEVSRQEAHEKAIQDEAERKARAKVAEENRQAKEKANSDAREAKEKEGREGAKKAKTEDVARPNLPAAPATCQPIPVPLEVIETLRESAPRPVQALPSSAMGTKTEQVTVVIRFTVQARRPANTPKIVGWFQKKIKDAGITDPHTIKIIPYSYCSETKL